jgi:hypothetical protein
MTHTVRRDPRQDARHGRFDGAARRSHEARRRGLGVQPDASTVVLIALAPEKTLPYQSLEDPRDRARMQMEDARKLSSRETWALGHNP